MTRKSILLAGATMLIVSGASFTTTALADDYRVTPVGYDDQAAQTRALNNRSLEQARDQDDGDDDDAQAGDDDDDDDGPGVAPNDDRDAQGDDDDDDDDDGPDDGPDSD